MRRTKLTWLIAVAMIPVTMLVGGFASRHVPAGREVIKIVGKTPGPVHAKVTAHGAFKASGYFFRKKASLIFPKGRLVVKRHVVATRYRPPNLATCWFKISQRGTFRVSYATGRYRGLRYKGKFWTHFAGRLKRTGPSQCGSKVVQSSTVTYEIGKIP